jgi:hypothetical protein
VRHHQRRALDLLHDIGHCERLPGSRYAEKRLVLVAGFDGEGYRIDRRRLVAGGLEVRDELKFGHSDAPPLRTDVRDEGREYTSPGLSSGRGCDAYNLELFDL